MQYMTRLFENDCLRDSVALIFVKYPSFLLPITIKRWFLSVYFLKYWSMKYRSYIKCMPFNFLIEFILWLSLFVYFLIHLDAYVFPNLNLNITSAIEMYAGFYYANSTMNCIALSLVIKPPPKAELCCHSEMQCTLAASAKVSGFATGLCLSCCTQVVYSQV